METVLEPLLHSPRLARYRKEIDRAWHDEQERRRRFFDEIEPHQKAEFINGEVIMHSPSRARHSWAVGRLQKLLGTWCDLHDLGMVMHEKTLICLTRNDYEPDLLFFGKKKAAKITADQMKFPAPDFIIEVLSSSTEKNDRGIKFQDYADHGVGEYWIVDPVAQKVEQYWLGAGGQYQLQAKLGVKHQITARTVAKFTIQVAAIFDGRANLAALRDMLR